MNKKLLLFCVTMLASVTMFAQNWDRPVAANYQFASEMKNTLQANAPYWEGDTTVYYLYNVEADAFLSNATCQTHAQWATHAALKIGAGNKVMMAQYRLAPIITTDTTYEDVEGQQVMKVDTTNIEIPEWDGVTYKLLDLYNGAWRGVFPTSTYAMFVDRNGQEDYMWNVKSMGNGVYRISVSDLNPNWNSHAADSIFGNPETYLGFNKLDNDYDPSLEESAIVMPLTPMLSITGKAYNPGAAEGEQMEDAELCIDWKFMPEAEYEKYLSHLKAWDYIYNGELDQFIADVEDDYGNKFDLSTLKALLNSTTPVLYEDIEAAITATKKAILEYHFGHATDDEPVDATSMLVNPDLETGNVTGWTVNYVQGQTVTNLGFQNNQTYSNGDILVSNFIEAWANSNFNNDPGGKRTLGNGSVYQLVKDLPAGKYKFECDAVSSRQDEPNQSLEKGAYLFAKAGENVFKEAIHTGNGVPEHFELMFVNATEADLEFGFMTENTTVNWICADNFKLWYYGPVEDDPFKVILDAKIAQYEKEYPDVEVLMANNDVKDAYSAQLDAAKNCTSDYRKEDSLLTEAYKALVQSVADYVRMEDLMEELSAKAEAFENGDFPDLGAILGEYYEFKLVEAYNEGTADAAMIDTISSTVSKMIVEYITANVKPGDELTPLIMNPDFNTDFSGWQVSGSAPVWGGLNSKTNGQGANQSAKYGEIDVNGGNAEKWHASFTMSQIVRDMPKGAYKLTVQAFERNDDATTAKGYWDQNPQIGNEAGINAYLFCNDFKKKIHNIYAFAQAEQIYESDELADVQTDYGWIPNGMTGSNFYFHLDEDRKTYQNEINFTLTTDGDSILIGLTNPANNTWVIFDNFRLFYIGADASAYMDAINELLTKLNGLFEEAIGGNDAKQMVQDAIEALNQAVASNEGDKCLEAIGQADAALEYAKTSIADYAALDEAWNNLISSIEENSETAPTDVLNKANTLVDDIDNVLTNLNKNNEEVEALIDRANYFSSALKITVDYSDASIDNPVDLSEVIVNSTFDTVNDFTGWSGSSFGAGGTTSTNAERYAMGFDTYQDLSGLPAGHYVAYVQAFYRHGDSSSDYSKFSGAATSDKEAYFYATSSIETVEKEVDFCSDGRVPTGTEWVGSVATSESGSGYIMPNTMQAMQLWCDQVSETTSVMDKYTNGALYYNHLLQVQVGEDGKLRIGVKKDGNIDADWFICDNFRLYYIGTEGTDPVVDSSIKTIEFNPAAANNSIYNLAGQKLSAPVKGFNIINGQKFFVK